MWTTRTFTTTLSTLFKRPTGSVDDGSVPDNKKNPSTPLIVYLQINHKPVRTIVDTGSANSIVHINTLHKLFHRPYIEHKENVHRTANNGELHTIGLVKLKIYLKNIPTFIQAEVAVDLCASLVLGNDWICENGIDIITTKQFIQKHQGLHLVTIPFSRRTLSPRILLTTKHDTTSLSSPSSLLSIDKQQQVETTTPVNLTCRVCYHKCSSRNELYTHLHENGHHSNEKIDGCLEKLPPMVFEEIKSLH
jgi:hypothetical protein